jgi:hypothetical protein
MGYHLTILRTDREAQKPLSRAELERAAASIPGWRLEAEKPQVSFFVNDREVVTLWLDNGELWTKNATDEAVTAMIQLATALNARVRGDEFETYRAVNDTYVHPDDKRKKATAEAQGNAIVRRTKRNQWILNISIFSFFVILGLIVSKCTGK